MLGLVLIVLGRIIIGKWEVLLVRYEWFVEVSWGVDKC